MVGFALVVVIGAWLFGQPTDYREEFRSAAQKDRERDEFSREDERDA
jgi:hypothetical protein